MSCDSMTIRLMPTAAQGALIEKTIDCCAMLWNRMITDEAKLQKEFGRRYIPTPAKYKREFPELKEVDSMALSGLHHKLLLQFRDHEYNPHDYQEPKPVERMDSYTTYSRLSKGGFVIRLEDGGIRLPKLGVIPLGEYTELPDGGVIESAIVLREQGNYFCRVKIEIPDEQPNREVVKQPA